MLADTFCGTGVEGFKRPLHWTLYYALQWFVMVLTNVAAVMLLILFSIYRQVFKRQEMEWRILQIQSAQAHVISL